MTPSRLISGPRLTAIISTMNKRIFFCMTLLLLGGNWLPSLRAQVFSDQTTTQFPASGAPLGVGGGDLLWADFDQDGNLDLFLNGDPASGGTQSEVYRYDSGAGAYTQTIPLNPAISTRVDASVGDLNHDGYPDLAVTSRTSTAFTRVYLYDPISGTLSASNSFSTPLIASGFALSAVDIADYNNDGFQDLALVGRNGGSNRIRLYQNQGGNALSLDYNATNGVEAAWIEWGDYDQDGNPDLLLSGIPVVNGSNGVFRILRKTSSGQFSLDNPNFIGLHEGGATWADYDHDGDLDVFVWGEENGTSDARTIIYRNEGLAGFSALSFEPEGIRAGQVVIGDCDNDGWRDLILAGNDGPSSSDRRVEVYFNDQGGGFIKSNTASNDLADLGSGARLALGDYNLDGRLDLIASGNESLPAGNTTTLFQNDLSTSTINLPQPANATAAGAGSSIFISWSPPAGLSASLADGLSYAVYVGTNPGGVDVVSPLANLTTGQRRTAQDGPIHQLGVAITDLAPGTYYWGVQAVGANFEGSLFTPEQSFTVVSGGSLVSSFADQTTSQFAPIPVGLSNGDLAWGDLDNDGDLDLVVVGFDGTTEQSYLFLNQAAGGGTGFVEATGFSLPGIREGDVDLVDIDNDNDLDIALSGISGGNRLTRIYVNNSPVPNAGFSFLPTPITLPGNINASFAAMGWGDLDSDGDLDLVLTGNAPNEVALIFENRYFPTLTRTFVSQSSSLPGVRNAMIELADFNQDGYDDIVLSGRRSTTPLLTAAVYFNTHSTSPWTFSSSVSLTSPLHQGGLSLGDLNNDGALDFVISGNRNPSGTPNNGTDVYLYDAPSGTFTRQSLNVSLPELFLGSVDLGDYNDDGWLDLVVTGSHTRDGFGNPIEDTTYLFRNTTSLPSTLSFEEDALSSQTLTNLGDGSRAHWGDYDLDGKLDLALLGERASSRFIELFRNIDTDPNLTLSPPGNLTDAINGFEVQLNWTPPTNATPGTQAGISYNLWLRELGSSDLLRSPQAALSDGFRKVATLGNLSQATSYTLAGLSAGPHQWTVQAIDQDHEGSAFAPIETFTYEDPSFEEVTDEKFNLALPIRPQEAAMAFADYDFNGFLDIAIMGRVGTDSSVFALYRYDAVDEEFFPDSSSMVLLPDLSEGAIAWGDLNQDNLPDLAFMGQSESGQLLARVRTNNLGAFSASSLLIELNGGQGLYHGDLAWFDYDNDGYQDLIATGEGAGGQAVTVFHRNNRQNNLISQGSLGVIALKFSQVATGDINQDGWLDLAIMGEADGGVRHTRIYLNDGQGGFVNLTVPNLPNLTRGDLAWGDYDADGWLDLVVVGEGSSGPTARVFHNTQDFSGNGSNALVNANAPIIGTVNGSVAWGDYDEDGYQDLIVSGQDGGSAIDDRSIHLYRYDEIAGQFVDEVIQATPLPAVNQGSQAQWLDFNRDTQLDLLVCGRSGVGPFQNTFALFQNINPQPSTVPAQPATPTSLTHRYDGYDVELSWNLPNGYPTNQRAGLSYEIVLDNNSSFTSPFLATPLADLSDGTRRLTTRGKVNDTTAFRLHNLPDGAYFWRVQAVDADFAGSPFSAVANFEYKAPAFIDSSDFFLSGPDGLEGGELAWADYDLDGDLDLLVAGESAGSNVIDLLENTNGSLAPSGASFTALGQARILWGDVDANQYPDLLVMGEDGSGTGLVHLYLNTNGNFATVPIVIDSVRRGDLSLLDLDNDGDQDLLLSGQKNTQPFTQLYRNDGTGIFAPLALDLIQVAEGAVATFDFSGDQLEDLLVMGSDGNGAQEVGLYRNLGFGAFERIMGAANLGDLIAYERSSLDVADYNRDGRPDLLVTGFNNGNRNTRVLRNVDGSGRFLAANFASPGPTDVDLGDARWGDYNDDGYADFALVGRSNTGRAGLIYRYDDIAASFVPEPILGDPIISARDARLAWGDYNQDGKLDLVYSGRTEGGNQVFRLLRNVDSALNADPAPPITPQVRIDADTVLFSWTSPSANSGYTYNLFAGSSAGQDDLVPALADLGSGLRRLAQRGNAGQSSVYKWIAPPEGSFEWGVQSIDPDFQGSTFLSGIPFTYQRPDFVPFNLRTLGSSVSAFAQGEADWGDANGDGRLDLMVSGAIGTNDAASSLLRYASSTDRLEPLGNPAVENLRNSALAWADYDRDGDLDLALMGETLSGTALSRLYRNDGNGNLTRDNRSNATLPDLTDGDLLWVDSNHDGALDLLMVGSQGSAQTAILLLNDGNGVFSPDSLFEAPGLQDAQVAAADFDRDGSQDLALMGFDGEDPRTLIYRNLGFRGGWALLDQTAAPLPPLRGGALAWADVDHDGFMDLVLSGEDAAGDAITALFLYDANSRGFVARNEPELLALREGHLAWGDYDDDGFADLIHLGEDNAANLQVRLYRNDNGTVLVWDSVSSAAFQPLRQAHAAWGDVDDDGKLDVVTLGNRPDGSPYLEVYRNQNLNPNQVPVAPSGLTSEVLADSVVLTWDAPAAAGQTFNLLVGTDSDRLSVIAPMADPNDGRRLLARTGHTGNLPRYRLMGLDSTRYYWQVQRIDADWEGSPFSTQIDSFDFVPPHFTEVTGVAFDTLSLSAFEAGDVAWADLDRDGLLDFVAGGTAAGGAVLELYLNQGGRRFQKVQTLPGLSDPVLGWDDVNRDGLADLLVMGSEGGSPATRLYQNTGDSLILVANTGLPDLQAADFDWGDFDHDGDPDLLLSGNDRDGLSQTGIWVNQFPASPQFAPLALSLEALDQAAVAWLDVDRDGYLDAMTLGNDQLGEGTLLLYLNDQRGLLAPVDGAVDGLQLLRNPTLAVADFDNNGYPDLAISGRSATNATLTQVWRHRGADAAGTLWQDISIKLGFPTIAGGEVAWGDYNDDGRSDLLITGVAGNTPDTRLLVQQADTTFTAAPLANDFLTDLGSGSAVAWGDYNVDGKLDLLLLGQGTEPFIGLFRNDERSPNQGLAAPSGLSQRVIGAGLELSWQAPSPLPAEAEGVSYQLYLTNLNTQESVISALADRSSGRREVPQAGVVGARLSWIVEDLQVGNSYAWGVQAIGADLEGSPFAQDTFRFDPPAFEWATDEVFTDIPEALENAMVAVADYDGDGDLDFAVAGETSSGAGRIQLYKNLLGEVPNRPNDVRFVLDTDQPSLPALRNAALAWGDLNGDNLPDLFIAERSLNNAADVSVAINQNGVLNLSAELTRNITRVSRAAAAWADYDGDGDDDLIVAGQTEDSDRLTMLYRNDDGTALVPDEVNSANLIGVVDPTLIWFDLDGRDVPSGPDDSLRRYQPDLFLAGTDANGNPVATMFLNVGNGSFEPIADGLTPVRNSSLALGFLNNDDRADLLIAGQGSTAPLTQAYRYDPEVQDFVVFDNLSEALIDVANGTVLAGDYNGDGRPDLLVAGERNGSTDAAVYQRGADESVSLDLNSTGVLDTAGVKVLAWGDFDNDGKPDLLTPSALGPGAAGRSFGYFRNIDSSDNVVLPTPTNLTASVEGNTVSLSWDNPLPAPAAFLTFNLQLRRKEDPGFTASPLAQPENGYRQVVAHGNRMAEEEVIYRDLPDGTYYWSVQCVGPDYEGAEFAPLDSFVYQNPVPEIVEVFFPPTFPDAQSSVQSYIVALADTNIERVIVHHRGIAAETWEQTLIAEGVWRNGADGDLTERFDYNIPLDHIDEMGVEYYFEVIGRFGNYRAISDTGFTYRYYSSGLTYDDLRAGAQVEAYQIITVPLTLEDSLVSNVIVENFGSYNKRQYRIFQYQAGAHVEFGDGADILGPGEGLWLITRKARNFNSGPGQVVEANARQPYQLTLQQGWNQIGNPYPFSLLWQDILDANPSAAGQVDDFIAYNNGYIADNLIPAKRGGFIFAQSAITLNIPVRKNLNINRVNMNLNRAIGALEKPHWVMPIRLVSGSAQANVSAVGMHPLADSSRDPWDAAAPPRMSDYLELSSPHPEHETQHFARDVVPTQAHYIWEMELRSSLGESEVQLQWDQLAPSQGDKQLILFDVEHQWAVPMAERESYLSISDQEIRQFRIYYGDEAFLAKTLKPDWIHLGWAYPNPVAQGDGVLIPVSMPEGATYQLSLTLMDLHGREIRRLSPQALPGGFHTLKWDGRDEQGQPLASGLYLYQLRISSGEKVWHRAKKLQIK